MKLGLIALCCTFVAGEAYGQDVAAPGIVVDFSDTIVVTGHRVEPDLPLAYEEHIPPPAASFTEEREADGTRVFRFRRVLLDFGGQTVEYRNSTYLQPPRHGFREDKTANFTWPAVRW